MDELEKLDVTLVNQDDLESSITRKANKALITKEQEQDEKRLRKTTADLQKTITKIKALQSRLDNPRTKLSLRRQISDEIDWFRKNELQPLQQDIADIQSRLEGNRKELQKETSTQPGGGRMEGESERSYLIRTGKITAFGNTSGFKTDTSQSHVFLRAPGFTDTPSGVTKPAAAEKSAEESETELESTPIIKEEKVEEDVVVDDEDDDDDNIPDNEYKLEGEEQSSEDESKQENFLLDSESDVKVPQKRRRSLTDDELSDTPAPVENTASDRNVDDGNEEFYQKRLHKWVSQRSAEREKNGGSGTGEEWFLPHPTVPDAVLDSRFKLPGDIHSALFDYQKTCVQWLWELHSQKTGGIIGDEMGLGKTIQVIAFLAGLHYLGLLDKPVLLVVPATVMNQWVNEFHRWWPPFRCVILHSIGSGMSRNLIRTEEQLEEHLEAEEEDENSEISMRAANAQVNAKEIVARVLEKGHVLVTTYVGLRIYSKHILPHDWGYAVLDEGHKIRNPNSEISLACKRIKTYNRVILSGTPIQNNLIELWSLFDFVFPGRLGTLPVFEQQFAIPINMGGYANATNVQVQTGYKCAVILRDLISPYLLRRLKVDVAQDLPKKSEMVLFVKLTQYQHDLYEKFLASDDADAILKGKRRVLMGVDILRKICNHPDLVDKEVLLRKKGYNYGNPVRSGKMQVTKSLLQLWQAQGHRTLLFCQTRQMLDILEKFVGRLLCVDESGNENGRQLNYLRMDGSTPISRRQQLVDTFNNNEFYHVFLLTTKVGGLGVNLTGADRVIIFDPDWNPSTDIQARERAWRLGQKKDITIYRLMTAGTIEEKIYHRQIFKTFLTNKILKDPKQRRFFKLNDLHDLFTLGDPDERGTETGEMFNGSEKTFGGTKERRLTRLEKPAHKNDDDLLQVASIMGVSKLDNFAGDEEEDEKGDETKDENRLMEGIFSNAGVVHSALQHDDIVGHSQPEMSLVEKEASRVAKEAAEALRTSRIAARKTAVGTPTWTGKFGVAGRFGVKKKPGLGIKTKPGVERQKSPDSSGNLSSSSILSELRHRRNGAASDRFSFGHKEVPKSNVVKSELLETIIDVLSKQPDGFAKSNTILGSLPKSVDLKNERELVMVRSLLREAADWQKEQKGWRLKAVFKADADNSTKETG